MNWDYFEKEFPLIVQSLRAAKESGRLGHSHLVISSNPNYRQVFPLLLGALAACQTPVEGRPCGKCQSCRQIMNGTYPDLYTLSPTSKSREIVIGKDDDDPDTLRSFESVFHLSSMTECGWKIGIVHEADTMNESAQNAFLKTLEEPPQKCIFILTTGRPAELLPTIRSRCQLLSLTDNHCHYDLAPYPGLCETLYALQFRACGNIVQAEDCAKSLIGQLNSFQEIAETRINQKWEEPLKAAENLESAGIKLIERRMAGETGCEYRRMREEFLSILHAWFAQIVMLADGMKRELLPNPEILSVYFADGNQAALNTAEAYRILNEVESMLKILRTNVSDALVIRTFCLNTALNTVRKP